MMSTSRNSSQMPSSGRQFLHTNVRHPSIGSSCNLFSHHKMSSTGIYHVTDYLATKVPCHQISAQEFDDNNHLVVSWLIKSHPGLAALRGIFSNETTTPLMSQLKSNEMVRRGIRCQDKFLNRQGDSSTSRHIEEERENTIEDDKKAIKRKRYSLRENTRKAKKVKREAQSYMKTRWNKCQKMRVGTFNRWSAERDMEDVMSNVKEELQKDQREMDEQFTKKMQEAILSFQVQSCMNSDFDSALVQVEKQLTVIPDSIMRIKDQMGTWSSMADLASKTTDCCAEKERNREALERCQEVEVKESVSTGEKTSAVTELQKLKTGFRICKPQGTFLSPKMGANDGSSPVAVQVEDLFLVHTPPFVSSSTSLAPPQLPYHHQHPTTSPSRPVPERCAVTVPVKTAQSNDLKNASHGCSSTTSNTTLINLNDIPDSDGAFTTAATERYVNEMVLCGIPPLRSTLCESKNNDSSLHSQARKSCGGAPKRKRKKGRADKRILQIHKKDLCIPIKEDINLEIDILKEFEQFDTPVAEQLGHYICGPLSMCDNIGIMFAIQTGSSNPIIASQEITDWIPLFEPYYFLNPEKPLTHTLDSRTSVPLSMVDIFDLVMENGVHVDGNYPFVGGSAIKYPVDDVQRYAQRYEKMRSTFREGQRRERYCIEGYKRLKVEATTEVDEKIINEVITALQEKKLVNGMIWASEKFAEHRGNVIFDQDLPKEKVDKRRKKKVGDRPDHIVLITGYGWIHGKLCFKIKNTYGVEWGIGGYGFVTARQIREYIYITGEVYSTGDKPPTRIVVFYTTEASKKLAEEFAEESNKKYTILKEKNKRHASFTFVLADLEDYGGTEKEELITKLKKESFALFFMDNEDRKGEIYLDHFYQLFKEEKEDKWLGHLQYAVFGLHPIAETTDRGLFRLGARRVTPMLVDVEKFHEWQGKIWTEINRVHEENKGDAGQCGPSS